MMRARELDKAKADTRAVYERQARAWDRQRPRTLMESDWLDRFADGLPPGGRLLDLGCGAGEPIAAYFLERGFRVVGIDYAEPMIAMARERFPAGDWRVQDMRALAVEGGFDGVYSWDGFFHLSVDEQRRALPTFANLVRPGGAMLLTVGTSEGEVTGTVGGETVYHASLSTDEYRRCLGDLDFGAIEFVAEDPAIGGRSVLLASAKGDGR